MTQDTFDSGSMQHVQIPLVPLERSDWLEQEPLPRGAGLKPVESASCVSEPTAVAPFGKHCGLDYVLLCRSQEGRLHFTYLIKTQPFSPILIKTLGVTCMMQIPFQRGGAVNPARQRT